jgi:uncharacterized protein YcbK (DUF882 family)
MSTYKNHNYKLSKNFRLDEFAVSKTYPELAEKIEFSYTDVLALELLAHKLLQPIRDKFGPLEILSGKRSPELNDAVGGSKMSDHLESAAADITPKLFEAKHIFRWVVEDNPLPYRQSIYYPSQKFVHLSINLPWREVKHKAYIFEDGAYIDYEEYFKGGKK